MENLRVKIQELIKTIEKILLTIINPLLYMANDFFKMFEETNTIISENIFKIVKIDRTNKYSSILYGLLLIGVDIGCLYTFIEGKIIYIPMDKIIIYAIIIVFSLCVLINYFIRHSTFDKKFKCMTIIEILIVIPIMIGYWIVSVEEKDFYLKNLNVEQWMSLFNNMIIYFVTCLFGVGALYKNIK